MCGRRCVVVRVSWAWRPKESLVRFTATSPPIWEGTILERSRKALASAIRPFGPNGKLRNEHVPFVDALANALGLPPDENGRAKPKPAAALTGAMKPSAAAVNLVKAFEGLHKVMPDGKVTAYRCPANVWTIGYGATGTGILPGVTWSKAKCEQRLQDDLTEFAVGVAKLLRGSKTTQHQFDALVSFAFNVGLGGLEKSTVLRKHKEGQYEAAAKAFAMWNKGGGRILPGLVRRRAAEAELYLEG